MRKILALAPVMADESEIKTLALSLHFLENQYQIDFLDPLSDGFGESNELYFQIWQQKLAACQKDYDAFIGFSLGGVILQQALSLFNDLNKPLFLFSTPSFADKELKAKLNQVISLAKEKRVAEALEALYSNVFIHEIPALCLSVNDEERASKRLAFGLNIVAEADSRPYLDAYPNNYLVFIGALSQLVNQKNIAVKPSSLVVVPHAGMRVLQDNANYCQKIILDRLNETVN
ncbi:MAG: hypothetical protein LCH30_04055 [Proteobacteria bacterium]|nr:hypothetical protein [Pseudomonadota bacterium]